MLQQARKVTLADDVVKQIGQMIQSGAWKQGDQLPPERQLMEEFGISRNTLREALKALNLMGVMESKQGGGNFVSLNINRRIISASLQFINLQDDKTILDLLDARRTIEVRTAYLAAQHVTPDLVTALAIDNQKMKENVLNTDEASKHDSAFHFKIAQATGNIFYEEMSRILHTPAVSLMRETTLINNLMSASVSYHESILEAIRLGDGEQAANFMDAHIKKIQETLFHEGD